MIISAMIFAGVTMIVGFVLGFLIGQSRSRMIYEEQLRTVEEARATLESQLTHPRSASQPNYKAGSAEIDPPAGGRQAG